MWAFELIHLPSFPSSGHLCVWFEQVQLISHLSMGSRLDVLPLHRDLKLLCVPKTLSVLMTPRNHLSRRNDRAPVFRRGRLGLTIQVEDPA
jgi:hypothetical protein